MTAEAAALGGRFEDRVHILPVRVYYEDTDFSGVVYHASYLRFAERGRSDFLRLAGVHHAELLDDEQARAFAVRRMEIDFLKAARIDDVLEVRTTFGHASGARLLAQQEIRLGSEPIWRADIVAACIDLDGKPKRLPEPVRAALAPYLVKSVG